MDSTYCSGVSIVDVLGDKCFKRSIYFKTQKQNDRDIKWELLHYLLFPVNVTLLSLMFSLSKQNIDLGPLEFAS